MFSDSLEEMRLKYFFDHSQSRRLRRKMAKELGLMKGKVKWGDIKDEVPPYNQPMNLGIKKFKRTGASYKDVLQYKLTARQELSEKLSAQGGKNGS